MTSLSHRRDGAFDTWESPAGNSLRMWMGGPHLILSEARGNFEIALARAFVGYLEPLMQSDGRYTGLHDWSGVDGYDNETRKLFTRWTDAHRKHFHRIVIYTESRIVRMGIATARMVLGSIVEAVGTRAELDALISDARR